MRTTILSLLLLCAAGSGLSQGTATFANSSTTLISAGGVPMPPRTSMETTYYFAIFLASRNTVSSLGQTVPFTDPSFQLAGAYNSNSVSTAGRIVTLGDLDVGSAGGWVPGITVDFIVRGWSANAGTTWTEALANWNGGSPLVPMHIGSSTVGNDLLLDGGGFPPATVFGPSAYQVSGFNMIFVPEPSALALAVLGGATWWASARRRKREQT